MLKWSKRFKISIIIELFILELEHLIIPCLGIYTDVCRVGTGFSYPDGWLRGIWACIAFLIYCSAVLSRYHDLIVGLISTWLIKTTLLQEKKKTYLGDVSVCSQFVHQWGLTGTNFQTWCAAWHSCHSCNERTRRQICWFHPFPVNEPYAQWRPLEVIKPLHQMVQHWVQSAIKKGSILVILTTLKLNPKAFLGALQLNSLVSTITHYHSNSSFTSCSLKEELQSNTINPVDVNNSLYYKLVA